MVFRLGFMFCVFLCAATNHAQVLPFLDDFSDGSATDGDPVSWEMISGFGGGTIEVVDSDLVMTPTERFILLAAELPARDNVSMQSQIRMLEPSQTDRLYWEFLARGDVSTGLAYLGGIGEAGNVYIRRTDTNGTIVFADTDLRPLQEDVVLQFDVIDSTLSMWAWRPSEPMPNVPLVSTVEDSLSEGRFGFNFGSVNEDMSSRSAAVRYVSVAASHIPEPTTAAICGVVLCCLLVYRQRACLIYLRKASDATLQFPGVFRA